MVFNRIFDLTSKQGVTKPVVICAGGKTDCFKPFRRTEADEMLKFLNKLRNRPCVRSQTRGWSCIGERTSLSTLENFLHCRDIIKKRKIGSADIHIFCEQTRERRINIMAKKIFSKKFRVQVIPIDFDVSCNRYIDPKFMAEKERAELQHASWALRSPKNLQKHHNIFVEKIAYFRKHGAHKNPKVIKQWWEQKLKEFHEQHVIGG